MTLLIAAEQLYSVCNISSPGPLPYVSSMNIITGSILEVTDSGEIQEETTYLNTPGRTMRNTTERPILIPKGTNNLTNAAGLPDDLESILSGHWNSGECPPLWDGGAASRATHALRARVSHAP